MNAEIAWRGWQPLPRSVPGTHRPGKGGRLPAPHGPLRLAVGRRAWVRQARGVGLKTSGIWGEGDVVSQIANRQYFFNVLFACSPT